ncbi:hypothetical protein [Xanthocytophaga agilis]|nr:hypothetical protein [Xanthocytophaga agilis]
MKNILTLILTLVTINSFGQKIDAPIISEWQNPKILSPDYRYNSASIYLVNGSLLPNLFSGATLTRKERNIYHLKANNYAKYVFLSVEIKHPKSKELLTIPLYLLDATKPNSQQFVASNMGRVLDEIKDEDLIYKPLDATGRLKAITGNSANEIAAQAFEISTSLFKTALALKEGPFGANEILQNVQKGAEYFKKIAQEKTITNEFIIPIIKQSDVYKYEIYSVSIHQIKWDFKTAGNDLLAYLKNKEQTLEQILGSLDTKNPYLVVVRYKSYYSLPTDWIKNVEIDQNYLNNRQSKLVEFSGMKKELESFLLSNLKEAISMKKDFMVYTRDKEINQVNNDVISRLMNSYFIIMESYLNESERHKTTDERKSYFENNYQEAYRILFNQIDDYINGDLKSAKNVIEKYFELSKTDLSKLTESELCSNLQSMEYYNNIVQEQQNSNKSTTQITSSKFYPKYNDLINKIEIVLYKKAFNIDKLKTDAEKANFLNAQIEEYPCCIICKEKANLIVTEINKVNDSVRKEQLQLLQKDYLVTLKNWDEIAKSIASNINQKYPITDREILSPIDKKILQEIEKQYQNIISASNQYLSINDIQPSILNSTELINQLNKYLIIRKTVSHSITVLVTHKLINETDILGNKE